jgi:hypothetical protein
LQNFLQGPFSAKGNFNNLAVKEGINMEQWLNMISDIGFPILVSFYLLHRVEVKLDAIHDALVSLK